MKRFLSLLLSVLVAFSAFPITVAASGMETAQSEMTAEAFGKMMRLRMKRAIQPRQMKTEIFIVRA